MFFEYKRYATMVVMLLSVLLGGCFAAVAVGAAGGLIVYDQRSIPMIERDARIFYNLRKDIVSKPEFHDSRISVTSFNEVVLLTGQTPSASLRVQAEKIALATPRVRRVYNEISVGQPIALSKQGNDTWITGQVRSKLLTQKDLSSGSIRVVTEDGNVYLMGAVTPEQATLATSAARQIKGVRKVVKVFQYIH